MKKEKTSDAAMDALLNQGWRKVVAELIYPQGSHRIAAYACPDAKRYGNWEAVWTSLRQKWVLLGSTSVRIRVHYPAVRVRIRYRPTRVRIRLSTSGFWFSWLLPNRNGPQS